MGPEGDSAPEICRRGCVTNSEGQRSILHFVRRITDYIVFLGFCSEKYFLNISLNCVFSPLWVLCLPNFSPIFGCGSLMSYTGISYEIIVEANDQNIYRGNDWPLWNINNRPWIPNSWLQFFVDSSPPERRSQTKWKAGQSAKDFLSPSGILWGIECVLIAILRFQAYKCAYNYCIFFGRTPSQMLLLFATST